MTMTFQYKNDSAATGRQAFGVIKLPGQPTAYMINGRLMTEEEFRALKPNLKIDTIKVVASYQPDKPFTKRTFAIKLKSDKDHNEVSTSDWPTRQPDSAAKMKPGVPLYITFKRHGSSVEDDKGKTVVVNNELSLDANQHPPVVIRKVIINGKNATVDDLNKMSPSVINEIHFVQVKRAPKDTAKQDILITTKKYSDL